MWFIVTRRKRSEVRAWAPEMRANIRLRTLEP